MNPPDPQYPDQPQRSGRARRYALLFGCCLLMAGCSWQFKTDYSWSSENAGTRHNFVLSRNISRVLYNVRAQYGSRVVASDVAKGIAGVWEADRYYCPAGGTRVCQTTSEYTRSHASDLSSAISDARSHTECVAITVFPPYNWTFKGRSNGCIYN
jgi:hypothetical protein